MLLRSRSNDDYPRPTARRRLLIAGLAVSTAITVGWLLLERPGAPGLKRPIAADAARCAPGQDSRCLGGKAEVIVPPAPPPPDHAPSAPA